MIVAHIIYLKQCITRTLADDAVAAETSLSEATTYAEMRTAVEAVTTTILTGSCGTDGDPCIDTEYINNKMSRTAQHLISPLHEYTSLAAAWLLVVPSAETIKSHYDTILTTMRTSVSYIGQFSIIQ